MTVTKLLRLPEVQIRTGKSRSSIYQGVADGTFPKQVKLGPRARAAGWVESEIEGYLQACIEASRSGDQPAAVPKS